ncbi:uncharacterized protein LOC143887408 isoform X2 [Tasmannia lanceolata]|uniref:uncharacterized protein LOC143887408 isoform X2 n=1 Tax=Tasmannia lanceolata TaxID=3420 RepID=UPI00406375A3
MLQLPMLTEMHHRLRSRFQMMAAYNLMLRESGEGDLHRLLGEGNLDPPRERGKRPFVEPAQVERFPPLHEGPFRIYDMDAPRRTYVPPPSTRPLTTAPTHRPSSIHMPSTSTSQRPPTDDTRQPSLDTGCRFSSSIPPHQPMPDHCVSLARESNLMEVPILLLDPALGYPNPKSSPGLRLRQGNELLLMVESLKAKICELIVDGERAKAERDTAVVCLAEVEARAKEVEDEARDLREAVSQRDEMIMLQELRIRELQLCDEGCNVGGEESDSEATISTGHDGLELEVLDLGYGDTQAQRDIPAEMDERLHNDDQVQADEQTHFDDQVPIGDQMRAQDQFPTDEQVRDDDQVSADEQIPTDKLAQSDDYRSDNHAITSVPTEEDTNLDCFPPRKKRKILTVEDLGIDPSWRLRGGKTSSTAEAELPGEIIPASTTQEPPPTIIPSTDGTIPMIIEPPMTLDNLLNADRDFVDSLLVQMTPPFDGDTQISSSSDAIPP